MRYIENADLREWVKDNLRKAIFQKAHALAVQTGCEILVKLEDTADTKNSQYYATNTLQHAFKQSGIREKPGDKVVCGETGLPIIPMVDTAVQSCTTDVTEENNVALDEISIHSANTNETNCKSSPDNKKADDSIIPLHLTVTSNTNNAPSQFQSAQSSFSSESTSTSEPKDSDMVLDFSLKNHQGATKAKATEAPLSESLSTTPPITDNCSNSVAMETDKSPIVALLQRPGLLQVESERFTCQMCGRSFPKQQLLRDHMSRSHMQPSMPIVIQSQASQSAIAPIPVGGLDHVPSQSTTPFGGSDSNLGVLSYPTTLPTFSPAVQAALEDNTIHQVWDQFIRETTDFYFSDMPQEDGKARLAYQHIGRTMYEKYPCILSEGQTPWSHFNKALSSKIRWRRQKRKYLTDPGGGGGRPAKRSNSTPSPCNSSNPLDEDPPVLSSHSEEEVDVKPDVNELNRRILLAQQQTPPQLQVHLPADAVVHLPLEAAVHLPSSEPSTSAMSPPMADLGIPAKGLKKNILMQTGFYLTPQLAAMGFSSTLQMTPEKVKPLLKQMSKEGYGIWVEDPINKDKCGFIKWYPLNEKQQEEVNLTNEQYKRACVAKPQTPRALSREMEQFFDACGGRKVRQNMSLL